MSLTDFKTSLAGVPNAVPYDGESGVTVTADRGKCMRRSVLTVV